MYELRRTNRKSWDELLSLGAGYIQRDSKRWTQFRKSVFQN